MQKEIYLKNSEELPVPDVTSSCEVDSDSANVTHAGLIHIFKLPKIGEYNWNFRLWSNAVILNGFITNNPIQIASGMSVDGRNGFSYNSMGIIPPYLSQDIFEVDCILNYIESVSLCVDSPEEILSKITNIPRIHQLQGDIQSILGVDLEFLN